MGSVSIVLLRITMLRLFIVYGTLVNKIDHDQVQQQHHT